MKPQTAHLSPCQARMYVEKSVTAVMNFIQLNNEHMNESETQMNVNVHLDDDDDANDSDSDGDEERHSVP